MALTGPLARAMTHLASGIDTCRLMNGKEEISQGEQHRILCTGYRSARTGWQRVLAQNENENTCDVERGEWRFIAASVL